MNRPIADIIPFMAGLLAGLLFVTLNVVGFDFAYFPGDLGDSRLNLYFLEHNYRFITSKLAAYWDAPFMYPEKNVLTFSDNLMGTAPFYALFRFLGFDLFRAYQLWFVLIAVLNYTTAFYFLKYVFKNSYAAALGAFVFAFSIALQSQLTHAQTFTRFCIPLAFWMAVKFSEGFHPKYYLYSLVFLVLQFFCGIYLGLLLSIPLGVFFIISLINGRFMPDIPLSRGR